MDIENFNNTLTTPSPNKQIIILNGINSIQEILKKKKNSSEGRENRDIKVKDEFGVNMINLKKSQMKPF